MTSHGTLATRPRQSRPRSVWRAWTPELLSLPALVSIVAVMGLPLVYLGWMSLQRWSLIGDEAPRFIGLQNFLQLAADERFVDALGRTLWFTLLGLVSNLPLGLGIALLMHERALNSTIVAGGATSIGLLLGVPAAYALARYRRTAIGIVPLMARMAPGIAFLIPLFVMFLKIHLVGSFLSLIASHLIFTLPLTVWMMVGFIEAVPIEIEKAALIDGCSLIGVLLRIIVPLTAQGIAATGILAFIASWNNFLFALVLANEETKTLPVAVLGYIGYNSIQWGTLMAAATLITLPVLALALSVQRYIVRRLVAGAVTG